MVYYDIMHSKKFIVTFIFILFIHQSISKTKRSKKDPVLHVKRRYSTDVTGGTIATLLDDVEDVTRSIHWSPDLDIDEGMNGRRKLSCSSKCESCLPGSGCTKCRSRTFLYLATAQTGTCVHTCPEGYYGSREKDTSVCKKCSIPNCASCFTMGYCTRCMPGFYLHEAECLKTCPNNMAPNEDTGKCEEKVDCEVGAWSSWSKCARRSASRACKYGRKKRSRVIVQEPTENGKACPKVKDAKRCKTPPNKCICSDQQILSTPKTEIEQKKEQRERKERKEQKKQTRS